MTDATFTNPGTIRRYFVDEAGDPALFNRQRRIVVGSEGCSKYFILGLLDVADPDMLSARLSELRASLLADPYLRGVPSLQSDARKTARTFHATDDLTEVRQQVFKTLMDQEVRFFAVVRDKRAVVTYVRQRNEADSAYRYNQNELYEYLGRRLFRDRLHKDSGYKVCFARRGSSDRTRALGRAALQGARENFAKKTGIASEAPITVEAAFPYESAGLQAVDYFLWALQRFYERHEERFLAYVWPKVSLVHDIDDTHVAAYGVYYTRENPLSLERRGRT